MDKIKLFSSEHILSRGTAPIQHELRVNFSRPVLSHTANPMIFRILIAVVSGVNSKQIPALHAHPSSKLIECPISPLPPTIPSPPNDLLVRASTAVLELDCRDYTVLQIARACSVCHVEDHTTLTPNYCLTLNSNFNSLCDIIQKHAKTPGAPRMHARRRHAGTPKRVTQGRIRLQAISADKEERQIKYILKRKKWIK